MFYFQIYPTKKDRRQAIEWCWRLRNMADHDIVATGNKAFAALWDCVNHVQTINQRLPSSFITVSK